MHYFYNVSETTLELPTPGNQGVRIVGVGEGFFGPVFYDKYVLNGLLAKSTWAGATHKEYVNTADFIAQDAITSLPSRYKTDSTSSPGGSGETSYGQIKFMLHYSAEASSNDPVHITYYFYTDRTFASKPTHIISTVGVLGNDWRFPEWAGLPADFYDLSPLEQREALLTKQ